MEKEPRSIFREEAVESMINHEERAAMPGLVSPRLFFFFWVLFGLLMALGAWLSFAEVKIYTSGRGIIIGFDEAAINGRKQKLRVVSFFPADVHAKLNPGKGLMLRYKDEQKWHRQTIISVKPEVLSPEEIKEKFGFISYQPVAVTISRPDNRTERRLSQEIFEDNTVDVRIESGSRKIASFLPVLGSLFEKQ
jgi:hypothetical protein